MTGGLTQNPGPTTAEERFGTIYNTLRNRICLLDYAPGSRLSEESVAQEFDVSRTPIRRVLGRMESEGLVEIRHGAGSFVTDVDPDYLYEVCRLRIELVTQIGNLSPLPATEDLINRMTLTQNSCQYVAVSDNPKRFFARLDIEFFEQLMEIVGNRPLQETLRLLYYRTARMWPYLMNEQQVIAEAETLAIEVGETTRMLKAGAIGSVGHLHRCYITMAVERLTELKRLSV